MRLPAEAVGRPPCPFGPAHAIPAAATDLPRPLRRYACLALPRAARCRAAPRSSLPPPLLRGFPLTPPLVMGWGGGGADDFWARCLCPPLFALCPADGGRGRGGEIPWTRAFAGRPPSPCRSFQSARNGGSAKPAGEWGVSALTAARRLPWAFVRTRNTCGTQPPARPVGTCDPPSAGTATPVARVADPQGRKGPPAERRSGGNGPVRRRLEQAKW